MPRIDVKVIEGVFGAEQASGVLRGRSDAMVAIEGKAMRPVTRAIVADVRRGNRGIGGNPRRTTDVRAPAPGAA